MFGFSVRTWQNGLGSPKSPAKISSPAKAQVESPKATDSPKSTDVGEIDTQAPFESVRAAVNLFGNVGSPRARPVTKKTKAEEQRLLEKETRHHMIIRELDYYKDQLRSAESAKAQASWDLQRANRTLQELTNKLENLSESKQAAIKATEDAKARAQELEEQQTLKAQLGSDAWKLDVDTERELYKASSGELIASKQELTNLRQDFDAALEAKLTAFQEAEDARQSTKENQEKKRELEQELTIMRDTLNQVKLSSQQAQEDHLKLIAEKEVHVLVHKSAKESAEIEIKRLKDENNPEENLEQKLEEATEAIKVLQEQLNEVQASDLHDLETVTSQLNSAKKEMEGIVGEETAVRDTVDSLRQKLDEVKSEHSECEKKAIEAESEVERLQVDLEKMKAELAEVMSRNVIADMQANLEKSLAEAEKSRKEAEDIKSDVELLRREAEAANNATKEADQKLEIALKEAEAAKHAEKLADDQIHSSPRNDAVDADDKQGSGSNRKINLSIDEFKAMNQKIEVCKTEADVKVATCMAQVKTINASEKEVSEKVEAMLKESEDLQSEIDDALKRAEMAEAAKKIVEGELQKWRQKEENKVGEISEIVEVKE